MTEPLGPWAGSVGGVDLPIDARTRSFYARCVEESKREMQCPRCGGGAYRDEVDVGVGIVFGPWGCPCGWAETDDDAHEEDPRIAQAEYERDHGSFDEPPARWEP